ncbi:BZ3500_MvSof-1268-A1-R1_Chr7-3g09619 [Microbotryum saponariae]|uniref:BZ3500_MvSof-1268-A1-R1_Chr7-3g09619 protein n=1 Tax=Microbotryum saponariae TaxID=289078 RepID=A0A2X0LB57_9BASI|nr:BZ3500_MvSof-1268-A1-R1_Chr7-3g09619 [Microbotryum saponariae]
MYSAQDIQCMKRSELQALCKTNKLKANGKTETLVQMLLDHFSLAQTAPLTARTAVRKPLHAPGSQKTKAPNTIKKKPIPVASTFLPTPQRPSGGADNDDDDEMRLQTPVAIRAKKVSAHNSLLKRALESSFTPAPATRPRAAIQAQATKKIISVLLATVDTLKAELATTRSSLTRLESTTNIVSAPSTPPLKRAEVLALVNERIVQHRAQVDSSIEQRFASVSAHLAELSKAVELATTREERESIIQLRDTLDEEVRSNQVWRRELEGSFETLRSNLTGHVGGTTAPTSSISPARAPSAPAQSPAFASPTLSNSFPPSSPAPSMKPDTPSAASERAPASAPVSPAILGLASTPAPNPASPAMSDGAPPTTTLASFSSPSASPRRTPRTRNSHKPSPLNIAPTTVTSEGIEPALALPLHMLSHVSPSKNKTISPRRGASSPQASPRRSLASASTPATATVVAMSPARSIVRSIGKRPRRESDIGDVSVDGMEVPGRATPSRAMGNSEAREIKGLSGGRVRKRMRISPGAESQVEQAPEAAAEYASESEEEEEEVVQAVLTSDPGTFGDEELLSEVYHQAEETTPPTLLDTPREFFVSTKLGDDSDEDDLALLCQITCSIAHRTVSAWNASTHSHHDLGSSRLC